ncbi:LOW QUALITY PROTEIN: hypothetical protein V2J09_005260 [Rumex salicifolius]
MCMVICCPLNSRMRNKRVASLLPPSSFRRLQFWAPFSEFGLLLLLCCTSSGNVIHSSVPSSASFWFLRSILRSCQIIFMKKPRVLKSWSKRNVPPDIWPNILSRLPVKSVLRFRPVSKSWKSMIDEPNFCRLHLTSYKNNLNETHLFIVQRSLKDKKKLCILRSCKHYKITATLNSLDTTNLGKKWDAIFSYGGETCTSPSGLVLWNPSIWKSRRLSGCIWVLENSKEWSKRCVFSVMFQEDFYRPKVLYLKKNGDVVFEWFPRQMTLYNLEGYGEQSLVSTARGLGWRFLPKLLTH